MEFGNILLFLWSEFYWEFLNFNLKIRNLRIFRPTSFEKKNAKTIKAVPSLNLLPKKHHRSFMNFNQPREIGEGGDGHILLMDSIWIQPSWYDSSEKCLVFILNDSNIWIMWISCVWTLNFFVCFHSIFTYKYF